MFALQYIAALWRRKPGTQLISFLYAIPLMVFVVCTLSQQLMPLATSALFTYRGKYVYSYETTRTITEPVYDEEGQFLGNRIIPNPEMEVLQAAGTPLLLHVYSVEIKGRYDPALSGVNTDYFHVGDRLELYIARRGDDLSGTPFVEGNFTGGRTPSDIVSDDQKASLFLSKNTALKTTLRQGETVRMKLPPDHLHMETQFLELDTPVVGYLKPYYEANDSNRMGTEYTTYQIFASLLIVEPALFDEYMESLHNSVTVITYTNEPLEVIPEEEGGSVVQSRRDDMLLTYRAVLRDKDILQGFVSQTVLAMAVSLALLILELTFIRKRNEKDFTVLRQLGLPQTSVRRIVGINTFLNYMIALTVGLLVCRFGYYGFLLKMHCEWLVVLAVYLLLAIVGGVYVLLATRFRQRSL